MAGKKKTKIKPVYLKIIGIALASLALGLVLFKGVMYFLLTSEYFQVKSIKYDSALEFVNKSDLSKLKGKSIFTIDLLDVQKKLAFKYPQTSQLRLVKNYPDQISVEAKKRMPFAQTELNHRTLTLDDNAIVLSTASKQDDKLPFITGLRSNNSFSLGLPVRDKGLQVALKIIRGFNQTETLAGHQIKRVNVEVLSKVYLDLSNNLRVIVDGDKVDQKMRILGFVLTQGNLDFKEVKYVDLRFKEPIIGKK